ncbi:ATP-dependent protease [Streptomyces sp. AJS327]|uniref:LON peptidase substrate-binding domain-containing protein n=1 Tax=Streptomyces sp. AJS327 TaxID=2545265 RepID=UPI0015DDBA92|nr:LON peptidase substrate-binding domain-containing protein [Streptomyces sp. AJS327]MBA0050357.1 ATP-dependent protease [Streptomyces sp. AJS327]
MTTALPLFPLNSVLFPGLVLPLNIFEPRYRALMRDLLKIPEDAPRRFAVVAIRDGHEVARPSFGTGQLAPLDPARVEPSPPPGTSPTAGFGPDPLSSFYDVACVADASTIRERAGSAEEEASPETPGEPDDAAAGYEVLATGTTRCRLLSVDASGSYLMAEVEELEETEGEGAGALASGVLRAFAGYQKRLASARERTLAAGQELPDDPSVISYLVAAATVLDTPAKQRLLEAPDTASRLAAELKLLRRESAVIGKLPSLPAPELTRDPTSPN